MHVTYGEHINEDMKETIFGLILDEMTREYKRKERSTFIAKM